MVNKGLETITGYPKESLLGREPRILHLDWRDDAEYGAMWSRIEARGQWEGEIRNRRKDGDLYAAWLSMYSVRDEAGGIGNYIGVLMDITERKATQARMNQLTYYDELTHLPNRQLFLDRLRRAIQKADRDQGFVALLFIDLDNFKSVNDSLGHQAGDRLLKTASERIARILQETDTLARLGGDEFTVVLEDLKSQDAVVDIAGSIIETLSEPIVLEDREVRSSASIGIAFYPDDATSMEQLMQYADMAMYRAKGNGKNLFEFFTSSMNEEALFHLEIENALRRAIERDHLMLYYQPVVSLRSGRMESVEALLRWQDPARGFISPAVFIPIAESAGLMSAVELWMLRTAARQLKAWQRRGMELRMSVNISDSQFRKGDFVHQTVEVIRREGMACRCFDLELTERIVMDTDESRDKISRLKEAGFKLSLDDFGQGQSSLSYLKRFEIDRLKIDKSFIDDLPQDPQGCDISHAIVSLAQAMHMETVAEGVEDAQQLAYLAALGCDYYQGYLFSRPVPADRLERLYFENPPQDCERSSSDLPLSRCDCL